MFHAHLDLATEKDVLEGFSSGRIRLLISTMAFGLGVDIPDIRTVFHYGCPSNTLQYWQEVGRCSRDGQPGAAILLDISQQGFSTKKALHPIVVECITNQACFRQRVLQDLLPPTVPSVHKNRCCFVCEIEHLLDS
jgi:superfamily II DNA helicase RecQ